jgi:hypothetical protein
MIDFDSDPSPLQPLSSFSGHAGASKRVEDGISLLGEELDEKLRQGTRKTSRVGGKV